MKNRQLPTNFALTFLVARRAQPTLASRAAFEISGYNRIEFEMAPVTWGRPHLPSFERNILRNLDASELTGICSKMSLDKADPAASANNDWWAGPAGRAGNQINLMGPAGPITRQNIQISYRAGTIPTTVPTSR
jgi:hypothetical protein